MNTTLDEESPRARLALLLEDFAELDDEREAWRRLSPRGGPAAGDLYKFVLDLTDCEGGRYLVIWRRVDRRLRPGGAFPSRAGERQGRSGMGVFPKHHLP